MAYYDKTLNEVVNDIITNIHDTLPEADTKSGTFIRNVFINPVSDEITAMYGDMKLLKLGQSVLTAVGDDLDYLAGKDYCPRKEHEDIYREFGLAPTTLIIDCASFTVGISNCG